MNFLKILKIAGKVIAAAPAIVAVAKPIVKAIKGKRSPTVRE